MRSSVSALCVALGMALGMALASQPAAAELSDGVVRIGVLNDQSGPLSDMSGAGSLAAARMAVEDFAKSNPNIKIEIVAADHQNKPDVGATIVRKWFDVDGVDIVSDIGNSAVALAIQSIAREKNKIVTYAAVATTEITGKQCMPTGLAWLHDSFSLVAGPIKRLVPAGDDTWFFIGADYAFGRNMVAESQRVLQRVGGKSLNAIYHPMAESDYSSYLLQAQASKAKVVAFSNAGAQLVSSMKQWQEFGLGAGGQRPVAQLLFDTDVHGMGLKVAAGLTSITAWFWEADEPSKAFGKRFFERHKAMPTAAQASVYSSISHYLKGVAAVGGDKTDDVLKWMKANPVDDFYAKGAKIREDGKLMHDFYLFEVKKPEESKGPWEYYKLLSVVPATDAYPPISDTECPLLKK